MPIAIIHIAEGRPADKKRALITNVTNAIAASLDAPVASVRVLVQEHPPELWGAGGETLAERQSAAAGPAAKP
jgi:4-oxalocrotonate tautomerase